MENVFSFWILMDEYFPLSLIATTASDSLNREFLWSDLSWVEHFQDQAMHIKFNCQQLLWCLHCKIPRSSKNVILLSPRHRGICALLQIALNGLKFFLYSKASPYAHNPNIPFVFTETVRQKTDAWAYYMKQSESRTIQHYYLSIHCRAAGWGHICLVFIPLDSV